MRGFFPGRFQPFHRGHRRVVEHVAEECDEVVIGIGSAQASHTGRNPFTAGERLTMIHDALEPLDLTTYVVPIQDIDRYALWVSHVQALCPAFETVYTNNPMVARVVEEAGIAVGDLPEFERDRFRGTAIRDRMRADDPWHDRVPDETAAVVEEIGGVDRLKMVSESHAGRET